MRLPATLTLVWGIVSIALATPEAVAWSALFFYYTYALDFDGGMNHFAVGCTGASGPRKCTFMEFTDKIMGTRFSSTIFASSSPEWDPLGPENNYDITNAARFLANEDELRPLFHGWNIQDFKLMFGSTWWFANSDTQSGTRKVGIVKVYGHCREIIEKSTNPAQAGLRKLAGTAYLGVFQERASEYFTKTLPIFSAKVTEVLVPFLGEGQVPLPTETTATFLGEFKTLDMAALQRELANKINDQGVRDQALRAVTNGLETVLEDDKRKYVAERYHLRWLRICVAIAQALSPVCEGA